MGFEDLGNNLHVIADAIAVPVARQAAQLVKLGKGPEKRVLFLRRQIEQDAVDVENHCSLSHSACAASFRSASDPPL